MENLTSENLRENLRTENLKSIASAKSTHPDDALTYPGFDCNSNLVNAYYVGVHAVSKNTYEAMIKAYFNGTLKTEQTIAIDITELECPQLLTWKYPDGTDENNDITVESPKDFAQGNYSVHFFKGLIALFNPDSYAFSKAKRAGVDTVVMIAKASDGTVLYRGDLTNMLP